MVPKNNIHTPRPQVGPSPKLDKKGVHRIQAIVNGILFYGRAVKNKLLVAPNSIGTQQASATEVTKEAVAILLDFLGTYFDNGIIYRASDLILAAHSDAGFHNKTKCHRGTWAHMFLSKSDPIPR